MAAPKRLAGAERQHHRRRNGRRDALGRQTATVDEAAAFYAQIGHGGDQANNALQRHDAGYSYGGTITVTGVNVALGGGIGTDAYAQIGHGGAKRIEPRCQPGRSPKSGDITVGASASLMLEGGTGSLDLRPDRQRRRLGEQHEVSSGSIAIAGNITVTVATRRAGCWR